MNFRRLRLGIGLGAVFALASLQVTVAQTLTPTPTATAPVATAAPATAGTPLPSVTAPPAPAAAPSASPSAGPRRGRRAPGPAASSSASAAPSDTPEPPQFTTLDGIWEVEAQPLGKKMANYSHLSISVTGSTISGYWEHDPHKTRTQMTGTFDGRLIAMSVAMPDGTTATFSGYVEGFADMVGLLRMNDKDQGTAFTAQHRKKIKT